MIFNHLKYLFLHQTFFPSQQDQLMHKSRGCFDNSHLIHHNLYQGLTPASCTVFSPFSKGNLYRYKRQLTSQCTYPISESKIPTTKTSLMHHSKQVMQLNIQSSNPSPRGRKKSLPQTTSLNHINFKVPSAKSNRSQRKNHNMSGQSFQNFQYHRQEQANQIDRQNKNIHFSQFIMSGINDSILHSRTKRQSYFIKTAKVRANNLNHARKNPKKMPTDNFSSIEVTSNSKYASSKKIVNTGEGKTHLLQIKKRLQSKFQERTRTQSKKLGGSREKGLSGCEQSWQPWQTHRMLDVFEDDNYLME